jgi:DNA-binding helix-hairpin-helix protein with protein kinase domain
MVIFHVSNFTIFTGYAQVNLMFQLQAMHVLMGLNWQLQQCWAQAANLKDYNRHPSICPWTLAENQGSSKMKMLINYYNSDTVESDVWTTAVKPTAGNIFCILHHLGMHLLL